MIAGVFDFLQIILFPLRLSVNQKGITVDQLIERRKVRFSWQSLVPLCLPRASHACTQNDMEIRCYIWRWRKI